MTGNRNLFRNNINFIAIDFETAAGVLTPTVSLLYAVLIILIIATVTTALVSFVRQRENNEQVAMCNVLYIGIFNNVQCVVQTVQKMFLCHLDRSGEVYKQ
ncbi:MAG: hypothetical protein IKP67_05165 [Spirochaetales bacterium]|nr:hypothetical protein [Spirochaetales bacterium]